MNQITDWSKEIHRVAVDKGWWKDEIIDGILRVELVKAVVPTKLLMIVTEIGEATAEACYNRWDTRWELEGWGTLHLKELEALLDAAYLKSENANEKLSSLIAYLGLQGDASDPTSIERWALRGALVVALCRKSKPLGFGIEVIDAVIRACDLLYAMGYDVRELTRMKHTFNETRSYRHGNKRF